MGKERKNALKRAATKESKDDIFDTYIYIYTPYFLLAKYSIRATKKSDKG